MRTPAKILLAGTLVAILPCAPATSQTLPSSVYNDQWQGADVTSDQTLDVVDVTDETSATTTATGNSADFMVESGDLDVRSYQTLQGNVSATAHVNVAGSSGAATTMGTAATGNAGDGGIIVGTHTGVYNQVTQAVNINALGHIEAPGASAGDVSVSTQAIGNSQGLTASYGATGVTVNQNNLATVTSDGGGALGHVTGTSNFSAVTSANNLTLAGIGSGDRVALNQTNYGPVTQAAQFTTYGNAYVTSTQATATGNNITANEQGALLDITAYQENNAYLRAQSESVGFEFGAGSATAYGVGNSLVAGNVGETTQVDSIQVNAGGGIEVIANYSGGTGYDASSSATAVGNASTAYACSDCFGRVNIANRQTNSVEVAATSRTSVTSGRSAVGVANAVGNTASYYVSRPH